MYFFCCDLAQVDATLPFTSVKTFHLKIRVVTILNVKVDTDTKKKKLNTISTTLIEMPRVLPRAKIWFILTSLILTKSESRGELNLSLEKKK